MSIISRSLKLRRELRDMDNTNLEMLHTVARAFGDLCERCVFVGGTTVEFFGTDPGAPGSHPTKDVDCIFEIVTRNELYKLEESLRAKGFANDRSEGAPICRWIYEEIKVDVMPTDPKYLGFSNQWHKEGAQHAVHHTLNDGLKIRILNAVYFLASKLEAMKQRGMHDLRISTDFDDIVFVVRNRPTIADEILKSDKAVKEYICLSFDDLLKMDILDEAISAVLSPGEPAGTAQKVKQKMESIARN